MPNGFRHPQIVPSSRPVRHQIEPCPTVYLEKIDPADRKAGRVRRRRWTHLPPPAGSAAELEGVDLLNATPGLLGLVLFQRYRDVLLWHQTPPEERRQLFDPRGDALLLDGRKLDVPGPLAAPLDVLACMVQDRRGGDVPNVVKACSDIAAWAYESGLLTSAAAFARLAAVVDPANPDLAFAAGRATRDCGRFALAEVWFQRTISLGRRANNDEAKAAGYIGWGVLEDQRGRRRAARAKFETALRTATGAGLAGMAGLAHQYLMALTVPEGSFEEGVAHAASAARCFEEDDPRLIRLAVDIGAFLSEHGHFSEALGLYEAAIPFLTRAADRLAGLANIGRASAAVGDKRRFSEAWAEFDRLSLLPATQFRAESLLELAHGAATLRYWRHAARIVHDAERVAREHENQWALAAARKLEAAIEAKDLMDQDQPPDPALSRLTHRLIARLQVVAQTQTPGAAPD